MKRSLESNTEEPIISKFVSNIIKKLIIPYLISANFVYFAVTAISLGKGYTKEEIESCPLTQYRTKDNKLKEIKFHENLCRPGKELAYFLFDKKTKNN